MSAQYVLVWPLLLSSHEAVHGMTDTCHLLLLTAALQLFLFFFLLFSSIYIFYILVPVSINNIKK